ncbi:unnamed protein product [Mytilus edulis]|uniref:Death domain-containing protein n=1 Tax=Mytilus edulis TaxID=6550 RepID=A0A8S3U6T0_MYTED|nr:unnamed protein product [Mytilus edulis]
MASSINEISVEVDDIREIFRQICPYIIRQWKEVCRKLGIQELELAQLEAHEYHASKAHLAFKGLSLWYEHVGKSATKDKLVSALKQCGLYRAEEEIERLELRTLKVSPSTIRPSSRQPSASKRRPGTGHREPNDYTRINSVFNEKWRATILQDVQRIQERSTNFDETMDEYIRILNIIMPKGQTALYDGGRKGRQHYADGHKDCAYAAEGVKTQLFVTKRKTDRTGTKGVKLDNPIPKGLRQTTLWPECEMIERTLTKA